MKVHMNKQMNRMIKMAAISFLSAIALAGCGSDGDVPSAYQGVFQDPSGVKLDLTSSAAQLVVEGKTLKMAVAPISYDKLFAGQAGFYIYQEKDSKLMDVYMVTPDLSTKKDAGGIVYYTTDIIYLQIDLNQKNPVPAITLVHADQGTVMLDTQTKTWQAGWPAQANEYSLVRTAAASDLKL
jgi:hypothetical protein